MNKSHEFGFLAVFLSCACGAPAETDDSGESTATTTQFLEWSPSAALLTEHENWHQTCNTVPGGRVCSEIGEDFMIFHRNFLDRLRDDFAAQQQVYWQLQGADIAGWTELPPEMKDPANGWTPSLQAAENNLKAGLDPDDGSFITTSARFGFVLERYYHNYLHEIAKNAYSESAVLDIPTSPTSTYFFKIHGYLDLLYQRWQRGDFNKDGRSDLVIRSEVYGDNKIYLMNGAVLSQSVDIDWVYPGACLWYVGATSDLNLDGHIDLVWHGPGCVQTWIWPMNGTTHAGDIQLPSVDHNWRLIGSGDFNQDARPDLVWRHTTSNDLAFWHMNGTETNGWHVVAAPANHTPVAVGDVNDDLVPDIILRQAGSPVVYRYWAGGANFYLGALHDMPGTGTGWSLGGVGRFHHGGGAGDLMFYEGGEWANVSLLARLVSMSGGQANYSFATGPVLPGSWSAIQGPR